MFRTTEYSEYELEVYYVLLHEQEAFVSISFIEGLEFITLNMN